MPDLFPGPVLASLRADPGRPAFEIGPRTVSRGDLLAMVRRLAAALRDTGLVLSLSVKAYATHLAPHALGGRVVAARPGGAWDDSVMPSIARSMRSSQTRRWTGRHSRSASCSTPWQEIGELIGTLDAATDDWVPTLARGPASLGCGCAAACPALDDPRKELIAMPEPAPPPLQVLGLTHYLRPRIAHSGQRSKD